MASWRDLVAEIRADAATPVPAPSDAADIAQPPTEATDCTAGLPDELQEGLSRLEHMPAPKRLARSEVWPTIVADALRLAREGWAEKALALGWTPADLFGCGSQDSWDFEGLAVWLDGRTIALIDADTALTRDGERTSVFYRPDHRPRQAGLKIVPLWQFGRGK